MYFGHMQYDIDNRHYIYDGYYTNATAQHKFVYKFLILIKIDSSCYNWWMIFFSNNCCRFNHHFSKKNCKIERVDAFCICKQGHILDYVQSEMRDIFVIEKKDTKSSKTGTQLCFKTKTDNPIFRALFMLFRGYFNPSNIFFYL